MYLDVIDVLGICNTMQFTVLMLHLLEKLSHKLNHDRCEFVDIVSGI